MRSGYVSIIGRPNSGKSTLLNAIVKEPLAIVTHKAQTTRKNVLGIYNTSDSQIIFLDTPGYHDIAKPINHYMIDQVKAAIRDADVICLLLDLTEKDPAAFAAEILKGVAGRPVVIVLNKIDTVISETWQSVANKYSRQFEGVKIVPISAKTEFGVNELIAEISPLLPEGEPYFPCDDFTTHTVRELVSEIIREQVLLNMHQEIPYSTAVVIDEYKDENTLHRITASIVVEKDSQKAMVLGKGGAMAKRIGTAARHKIEALVGCKVFLKLFVRVEKNWTKDTKKFQELI